MRSASALPAPKTTWVRVLASCGQRVQGEGLVTGQRRKRGRSRAVADEPPPPAVRQRGRCNRDLRIWDAQQHDVHVVCRRPASSEGAVGVQAGCGQRARKRGSHPPGAHDRDAAGKPRPSGQRGV
jgi:hypothetical protein